MRYLSSGTCCLAALITGASWSSGAIIADFTDGNGASSVDQYQGIAGDGWDGPWGTSTSTADLTGSVVNSSPLNGGGNYLSSTLTATGASGGRGIQFRNYNDFGDVNVSAAHTISFDIRVDSSLATFNSGIDYFQMYDRIGGTDFANTGAWLVRAFGADVENLGTTAVVGGNWAIYNGNKDGSFSNTNFVDTGVPLVAGNVYHFDVTLDPTIAEYSVTINGGTTFSGLGFRNATGTVQTQVNFGGRVSDLNETLTYSLDSIAVTNVPEPSCLLVSCLGVLGLARRRRA
ncbi:PEP-CTERM sorting domain-containing protein [Haloferula sargassicola]|uniref:Ice-binding protein C-terminal domain-containing protein n=1 Tax=Haloferula sargassicola TaxID=490096 RepID=A0ABP9UR81_9BACT